MLALVLLGNLVISILSERLVRLCVHQTVNLRRVGNLDLRKPAVSLGALVDGARLVLQYAVGFHNLAADGSHDIRRALDRLDGSDGLSSINLEVDGGQFDVDDVAEGFGCICGHTNGAWAVLEDCAQVGGCSIGDTGLPVTGKLDPFVVNCVLLLERYQILLVDRFQKTFL
jgi:hypothetical protein